MNFFQTILPMLQSGSFCISLENGVSGHLAQDQFIFDNRTPENVKTGKIFEFIRHYEMAKMSLNLESFLAGSSWSLHVREPGFQIREIWKFGNLGFGIRNTTNDWKLESKFHRQSPECSSWNPESTAWNLQFNTFLNSLTSEAPNENIIQNHLNIALLNVF